MFNLNAEQVRGGTLCLSKAGVAIGSTATKVKFAAPNGAGIDYAIKGYCYHKADTDDFWTLSGSVLAVSSSVIYLLCINSAGTMSIVEGDAVLTANITSGYTTLKWPQPGESVCPVGAVRVDTNASVTFTPGTTNLSAAGITDTYYDFFALPEVDLTS